MVMCSIALNKLERFSFECFFWFCIFMLCDWFNKLAPHSQPIRSKTNTSRDALTHIFPRFASATCICVEFWLVHGSVVSCDWSVWLLLFSFYDTHLKAALDLLRSFTWRVKNEIRILFVQYQSCYLRTAPIKILNILLI